VEPVVEEGVETEVVVEEEEEEEEEEDGQEVGEMIWIVAGELEETM